MASEYRFLAFDLGAESGRAVLGTLADNRLHLQEVHRFRTEGLIMLGTRQWDLARIYEEMIQGLCICARDYTSKLDGIGCDTWGVDFGLVAKDGTVLANPRHYRDKRNEGMQDAAFALMPREELYMATGIQFLPFNSVYQLLSLVKADSPLLAPAESMLLMGDLLGYLLSGKRACEYTNASTTQMLDPFKRTWNDALIDRLGLPRRLLLDPVKPGTVLGPILPEIAQRTGIDPNTPIIAPGTHDTASAVAAVPVDAAQGAWAYLSSGTWSLLGAELDEPHVSDESLALDFTNEGGVGGKIRFLKNIFGLWLVQECRRAWERDGQKVDYAGLTNEAEASKPFLAIINLDDPRLLAPEDMPSLIQAMCRETKQPVPETRGEIIRCALESLALKYRQTLRALDKTLGRKTERLHIIGGGTQNRLLNQMTADACGIPVITGPIEATAMGNIGVQAMAAGALKSLAELRAMVANSSELDQYRPENTDAWDAAERHFEQLA
ncbi:MAG: rhamnulokinase [Candidatus Hydrogenedentes bacterium]|nr:rhamnulokinase [Candidatus Hydrogenedentota bacterium]